MAFASTLAQTEALLMTGWIDESSEPTGERWQFASHFQDMASYYAWTLPYAGLFSASSSTFQTLPFSEQSFEGVSQNEAVETSHNSTGFRYPPQTLTYVNFQQAPEIHQPTATTPSISDKIQKLVQEPGKQHGKQKQQYKPTDLEVVADPPKGKKRGRKTKALKQDCGKKNGKPQAKSVTAKDAQNDRHRRVIERNRLAAARRRQRKQSEVLFLVSQEEALANENRYLSSDFHKLKDELYFLKSQVLRHNNCSCVLIQRYIAEEALRTADSLPSGSPSFVGGATSSSSPWHPDIDVDSSSSVGISHPFSNM